MFQEYHKHIANVKCFMYKNTYLILNLLSDPKTAGVVTIELTEQKKIIIRSAELMAPNEVVGAVLKAKNIDIVETVGGGHLVLILRAELARIGVSTPVEELSYAGFDHAFMENFKFFIEKGVVAIDEVARSSWNENLSIYFKPQAGRKAILVETVSMITGILRRDGWPDPLSEAWEEKRKRLSTDMARLDDTSREHWLSIKKEAYDVEGDSVVVDLLYA